MATRYSIYFNNYKLVIGDKIEGLTDHEGETIRTIKPKEISKVLQLFVSGTNNQNIFVYCAHAKRALKHLKHSIKVIKAAGGLVQNNKGEYLLIYRRGFWDLPKGKIEKGEGKKKAAIREVTEETGVQKLKIKCFITKTYHIYEYKGVNILKLSYWYLMKAKESSSLTPQTDEDIELAKWVTNTKLNKYLANAYNNIVDVFNKHLTH